MKREFLILFFLGATLAFFLGKGYYESLRSGVLTVKGRTSRRDEEPVSYWLGMAIGTLAFLAVVALTAVMAFVACVDLFQSSK